MPIIPKERDCGWFYYSPPNPALDQPRVDYPRPSQIECLNSIATPPLVENKILIRDSDSKYIQLAKMGGRADLLTFKENQVNKGPGKAYPRSEWYYLEDNLLEDRQQASQQDKEPYHFGQPDYMMHAPYNATEGDATPCIRPAPWAVSKGKTVTQRLEKIPERIKPGYGVRNKHPVVTIAGAETKEKPFVKTKPVKDEEACDMGKLLSNEYEREWQARLSRWQDKRAKAQESLSNAIPNAEDPKAKVTTECNQTIGSRPGSNHSSGSRRQRTPEKGGVTKTTPEAKELFKMSKFQNVASKVDSHREVDAPINVAA